MVEYTKFIHGRMYNKDLLLNSGKITYCGLDLKPERYNLSVGLSGKIYAIHEFYAENTINLRYIGAYLTCSECIRKCKELNKSIVEY